MGGWIERMEKEYINMRESFKRLKQSELEKIDSINSQIDNLEQAKRRCHETIKRNVPHTSDGELTCPNCEIISMKYLRKIPTRKDRNILYEYYCEICGHQENFEGGRMDFTDGFRRVYDKYGINSSIERLNELLSAKPHAH
ncbi:MAG: hypothetical protein KKF67_00805 [Nanoarchaeota archaeon]|nr:hypothetical protein [Nanoarchaeota archaeon]